MTSIGDVITDSEREASRLAKMTSSDNFVVDFLDDSDDGWSSCSVSVPAVMLRRNQKMGDDLDNYQLLRRTCTGRRRKDATGGGKAEPQLVVKNTKTRRLKANDRERQRMHNLNAALEKLRRVLPHTMTASRIANDGGQEPRGTMKMSKIETLRYAHKYIWTLSETLKELDRQDGEGRVDQQESRRRLEMLLGSDKSKGIAATSGNAKRSELESNQHQPSKFIVDPSESRRIFQQFSSSSEETSRRSSVPVVFKQRVQSQLSHQRQFGYRDWQRGYLSPARSSSSGSPSTLSDYPHHWSVSCQRELQEHQHYSNACSSIASWDRVASIPRCSTGHPVHSPPYLGTY